MKKLIFLLLMAVVLAGFVPALDTAHPPGLFYESSIENPPQETIMAEYGVHEGIVTQSSALVFAALGIAQPSSFPAVMALYNESAIQPQGGGNDRYVKYAKHIVEWAKMYREGQLSQYEFVRLITAAIELLRDTKADYYLRC